MIPSVVRLFLLLGVLSGILLPKSSAVLAELGLIPGQVLVICTGEGLETLVLDRKGSPIKVSHDPHPCLLVHAIDTATAIQPKAVPATFVTVTSLLSRQAVASAKAPGEDAQPRAPPVA